MVHVGFLIALSGHLIGSLTGFKSSGTVLFSGELTPVAPVSGLYLRLDDFTARDDSFGYRDYMKTTVTLFKNGAKVLTGDIRVNHPLLYKGIAFYYNDDGNSPSGIKVLRDGRFEELNFNDTEPSTGRKGELRITGFFPDFVLGESGRPYSRSEAFNNPYVALTMDGKTAFLKIERGSAPVNINGEEIKFAGFKLSPYVVLSINKDPGIWVVVAGSGILLLGMALLLVFGVDKRELIREAHLRQESGHSEG